ncbi:MAG: hypothetical protein LBN10_06870 [Propionibacteriaceae bacterium]|jgi:hypothetical protein|nr:hypothetical protein [Propionibacteriaceae bacterium]
MSTTTLVMAWIASAFVLVVVLVTMSVWYSRRKRGRVEGYEGLARTDRYIRWIRIGIVFIAATTVFLLLKNQLDFATALLAPAVWSFIVIIGLVALDFAALARPSGPRVKRHLSVYLPTRLIVVSLLIVAVLGVIVWYAQREATFDQVSYLVVWVKDGHTQWATRSPFAAWGYTYPLLKLLGVVLLTAIVAVFAVLRRPQYLPAEEFSLLDRGFRRRTIKDILVAFTACLAASTGIVAGNICWTVNSIGPDNIERTAVIVGSGAIAVWMFVTTCWCLANLLLLPPLEEDWRAGLGRKPPKKK